MELGFRRFALLAIFPTAIGAVTLLQDATGSDFGLDELLFNYFPLTAGANDGRMSPPVSVALLLSSLLVMSLARPRVGKRQTLVLALVASIVLSMGAANLLGYTLDLTLAYRWGYLHDTSPLAAIAVALMGIALLAQPWREHNLTGAGAPSWLPLPVVVGSATMTLILYMGLGDQELVRLRDATNRSAVSLAREVEDLMTAQTNQLGYFAREWSHEEKTAVLRGIEAESFLRTNGGGRAGQSLSLVSLLPELKTREVYPAAGNEHLASFEHSSNPTRVAAVHRSLSTSSAPVITGTLDLELYGPGYAIYVPMKRDNQLWGFLVASRTDNLVMISTPDGKVDWVNESFTRVMEFDLDEIYGKTPDTFLLGPESRKRDVVRIKAAMARGQGVTSDIVNYSKSGRKYHLHLEIQPIYGENGEIETYIAILADITTRVATEHALRLAKTEADHASRSKSEFLASMSHEIRTPMNGVIGMTSLLMDTALDPKQRDFVNTIRTSGEALLTIINDILDFSKIESGKMHLEQLPFDLPNCVEEALELFSMQASTKNLDLAYLIAEDVPPWIIGDVTRLRQILVNLVNNAIKFTLRGSITITVRKKQRPHSGKTDESYQLEFTIADSGIGIPKDRISRLFKAFSQVDSSTTRKYGGTGLGLAICHRLTEIMGGSIHAESMEGEGTQFIFDISTSAAHALNADPAPSLPKMIAEAPVLGVEDNAIGRQHLQEFFQNWRTKANTASRVNETAQLLQSGRVHGLVLLDQDVISQPGGEELLKVVEEKKIPTLVLLSPGPEGAHIRLNPPKIISINKPVRTNTLIRRVQSLLDATPVNVAVKPVATAKLAEEFPLTVLLVKDNLVNQKVAARFLDRLGYESDIANNGLEGFNAVQNKKYDLVLMDLQMPEMDGFTSSREIRQKIPAEEQPKIIALTANALQGDRELCLEAGMDDYITKPVKIHELREVIRRQFAAVPGREVPTAEA